jgi:hypothetical protein
MPTLTVCVRVEYLVFVALTRVDPTLGSEFDSRSGITFKP